MADEPVALENEFSAGKLLSENLNIPNYQRGYCWESNQIKPFLESLWNADKDIPYHLGTVIVHITKSGSNEVWDIVDGQQRLITLSILIYLLNNNDIGSSKCDSRLQKCLDCKYAPVLLRCSTDDGDMLWHVHRSAEIIREWINCHPIDNKKLKDFLCAPQWKDCKGTVCLTVVKITGEGNLPLAWTFFNSINSGGKSLSDYDLLKAHHLRYMGQGKNMELMIRFEASRWDELGKESVTSFYSFFKGEAKLYTSSFAHTFYLIRSWLRNREIDIKRWQLPAESKYCVLSHYSALSSFSTTDSSWGTMKSITTGFGGGKQFFDWSEYWLWQFKQFCENPVIKRFLQVPWKDQQIHLLIIVRAVLFYYYIKFGNVYLADACILILYRLGKLRNRQQNLYEWYNGRYAQRTIDALDESPAPEYFFQYCQMPSNRYVPRYDLKKEIYNYEGDIQILLSSWRHGPDWWKKVLGFAASGVVSGINTGIADVSSGSVGKEIYFKKEVKNLLNEVAKDFGWEFSDELVLGRLNTDRGTV